MSLERFTRKELAVVDAGDPARKAAEEMLRRHVGAVVALDGGRPVGMVTDRDLALRVVAAGRDPSTPVRDVMSTNLVTVRSDQHIDDVAQLMRASGVRRLPVIAPDGALVGVVSLDDLYVLLAGELSTTAGAVMDNRGP